MLSSESRQKASPARMLEMLTDRFGAFEALAYSSIKLARAAPEEDRAMDVLVAEAVLEFADDLRQVREATSEWLNRDEARGGTAK